MIEGIGTPAKLNQDSLHTLQGREEGHHERAADVVEGKVNPVEPLDNLSDESDWKEKTDSQEILSRASDAGPIIDLYG
jgi:hypothetical protein